MPTPIAQIALITAGTWIFWRALRRVFTKNPLDNLPGPSSKSFLTDGGVLKLDGAFGAKTLYVHDPKALHHILVKDLYTFEEDEGFSVGADLSFGKGLFATTGERHRKQRKMLNPVFSIAHMREMVPIFYDVAEKLQDTFLQKVSKGPQEIDVIHWMARTALELIGQSGLGYTFDPLTENAPEHPYVKAAKMYIPVSTTTTMMTSRFYLLPTLNKIGTPAFRKWVMDIVPWKNLHDVRDLINTMNETAVDIIESKKRAIKAGDDSIAQQVGRGKDVITTLIKANMEANEADRLPDEELLGQVSTLTFAATDSTSTALSRIMHVLSEHQDVQDKLRAEIRQAHEEHGPRLPYDVLVALPLLDAVCRETLRLYPPVPTLLRETRSDAILPFSKPIIGNDGKEMTEVLVPKGTKVFLSILGSNSNPDIWGPDAYEWKPEKWLEGLPESVIGSKIPGIYSHLMTFLGGGRACIGFKFSQLEMKIVTSLLLDKFRFDPPKDKEIYWQMAAMTSPTVNGNPKPQLPLVVSLAD
ncbi:hypothetical protein EST38_g8730 [Candolleomyces aberdarensis]|uniref:Cytochrome P450 n=1 Tax=Candolleomyces aberdarensis TaxID=2316362 RepID=A0A4Q2DF13_9AGAR|nr:hypothetical protein EST38_g8730 [Candolleomyces aberdarensis]